jgi:hypothetical protein
VWDRADGVCEADSPGCLTVGQEVHHIAGRGGPDPHRLDNLLLVCRECHATIHDFPEWSMQRGYMVSRHGGAA